MPRGEFAIVSILLIAFGAMVKLYVPFAQTMAQKRVSVLLNRTQRRKDKTSFFKYNLQRGFTMQKTWTDLLGKYDAQCQVRGRYIIVLVRKCDTYLRFRRLWTFETPEQAKEVFETWKAEKS